MVIIKHTLSTGKVVTDTYGRAVEKKVDNDTLKLLDRNKSVVATFLHSKVVDAQVVNRLG